MSTPREAEVVVPGLSDWSEPRWRVWRLVVALVLSGVVVWLRWDNFSGTTSAVIQFVLYTALTYIGVGAALRHLART